MQVRGYDGMNATFALLSLILDGDEESTASVSGSWLYDKHVTISNPQLSFENTNIDIPLISPYADIDLFHQSDLLSLVWRERHIESPEASSDNQMSGIVAHQETVGCASLIVLLP
jgi:hypothetical protein